MLLMTQQLVQKCICTYWLFLTECDSDDNMGVKSSVEEFRSTEGNLVEWILFFLSLTLLFSLHKQNHPVNLFSVPFSVSCMIQLTEQMKTSSCGLAHLSLALKLICPSNELGNLGLSHSQITWLNKIRRKSTT